MLSLPILAGAVMLAAACAAPGVTPAPTLTPRPPTVAPTPTVVVRVVEVGAVPVPTATPIPPTPAGPRAITDGTFVVGTDLQPGTYRAAGGDGCYWERLRGFGGTIADVIANDNARGPVLVTIAPTDVGFTARRCGAFTRVT